MDETGLLKWVSHHLGHANALLTCFLGDGTFGVGSSGADFLGVFVFGFEPMPLVLDFLTDMCRFKVPKIMGVFGTARGTVGLHDRTIFYELRTSAIAAVGGY